MFALQEVVRIGVFRHNPVVDAMCRSHADLKPNIFNLSKTNDCLSSANNCGE